jgi:hypothetical protein
VTLTFHICLSPDGAAIREKIDGVRAEREGLEARLATLAEGESRLPARA